MKEYMNEKPIAVVDKSPSYPIQRDLFENLPTDRINYGYRKRIGDFYEILTTAIFGGRWIGTRNASQRRDELFQPDVVSKDKIIESKSVCWSENLKLVDFQIDQYLLQQCDSFYQQSSPIFFAIYKYKVKNPLVQFKQIKNNALEEIVKTLSEETAFMIFLPFSIISPLHNPTIHNHFNSRYENGKFDPLTRFKTSGIKKMLFSPEEVIKEYGLNPEDYLIIRTCLPEGIKMNNFLIKPFPILFIEDLDYKAWLGRFKEENASRVESIRFDEKKKRDYLIRNDGCSDTEIEKPAKNSAEEDDDIPF